MEASGCHVRPWFAVDENELDLRLVSLGETRKPLQDHPVTPRYSGNFHHLEGGIGHIRIQKYQLVFAF